MTGSKERALQVDIKSWVIAIAKNHPEFSRVDCERAAVLYYNEIGKDLEKGRRILSVGTDSLGDADIEFIDIGALLKADKESR